jgi:hypothetical protein
MVCGVKSCRVYPGFAAGCAAAARAPAWARLPPAKPAWPARTRQTRSARRTPLTNQPPSAPPVKKPRDCKLLYTPSAVPRAPAGATRDAMLGWLASRTLKPQKNTNSSMASTVIVGSRGRNGQQAYLHQRNQANRRQEHGAQVAPLFQRKQRRTHYKERAQHGWQVDPPMVVFGAARPAPAWRAAPPTLPTAPRAA